MSDYTIETRRRSRSKTPFLRSNCDHEACEYAGEDGHVHHHPQHKKKTAATSPNVHTIAEETVEVTSSSSHSPSKQQTRIKTSDYSSEDVSPENKAKRSHAELQQTQSSSSSSKTTTTTTVITKNKKLGASTSTPKSNYILQSFASQYSTAGSEGGRHQQLQRRKEVAQNEINSQFERSQKAAEVAALSVGAHSKNRSFSRFFGNSFTNSATAVNDGSDNSVNKDDLSDHVAYMEYKRAGEYWKTTPKTDYTYSELSPHRRVLAPGIVAMPNMSRQSLENHHERINYMIERDPAQEEYIRRRYESSKYTQNRRATEKLMYESGDEIDHSQFDNYRKKNQYYNGGQYAAQYSDESSWYMRIITTIATTVSSVWSTLTGGGGADNAYNSALYRTKYANEERGFFGSIAHGISSTFAGLLRYVYLFISSILCLDTWLLQSSNAENKSKKRFLLLLLILLPLLLLAAWYLLDENERLYYLQRSQALLPLSLLASLKSTLHNTGTSLQGLLQLPAVLKSSSIQYNEKTDAHLHLYNIQQNMQKTLTPEEYENILNHVNSYVQQLVDIKIAQQKEEHEQRSHFITPQQTQLIVQIMRENLEHLAREKRSVADDGVKLAALSEQEVQNLAHLVQLQLVSSGWSTDRPARLSSENMAEIIKLINEHIQVNNHAHYTLLVEKIDLDALLTRILQAPQLAKFIDARINFAIDGKLHNLKEGSGGDHVTRTVYGEQQHLINKLNSEIAFIKLALSENEDLHQSISKLRLSQDDLLKRMLEHELSTDTRFSALLAEIESKLSALKSDQFTLLNKQIKVSLVEILGFKQSSGAVGGGKLEDIDLQNWVRNMFVAKDYLEKRLLELNKGTNDKIKEEIDRSGMVLMRDISERLKKEILLTVELKTKESTAALKGQLRSALSEEEVHKIVKSVLAIYDADKTGLVDFALESAGGQILSTRCTESYQTKTAQISVFGIPLWYPTNTPRVAISPNVQPGECWAFQGFPGFLVLKLNSLVYVTGFTLEHIPKTLSPDGHIDSAPKNFTVWGLEHEKDQEPILFGEYEYADNDASLQYFPVHNKTIKRPYDIVELRIESNHGHPQYTCLYRFRVHGKPPAV